MCAKRVNWIWTVVATAALCLAGCSSAEEKLAEKKMALAKALEVYAADCGKMPDNLQELMAGTARGWNGPYIQEESLKDPWGNEFVYLPGEDGLRFVLISAGAEGDVQAAKAEAREQLQQVSTAKQTILRLKAVVLSRVIESVVMDPAGGELPDSLHQLIDEGDLQAPSSYLLDPWGHEYIYTKEGHDGELCEIFSAGPDGIAGTGDDVHAKR